jgi:hypothetical protein
LSAAYEFRFMVVGGELVYSRLGAEPYISHQ